MQSSRQRISRVAHKIKDSGPDKLFYKVNGLLMLLIFLLYGWVMWFVVIASFSDPNLINVGQVILWPRGFHLGGYKLAFEYKEIFYLNTTDSHFIVLRYQK